jgi:hypothetical protein
MDLVDDRDYLNQDISNAINDFSENINNIINRSVEKKVTSLMGNPAKLVSIVENCPAFKDAIYDYFKKSVAVEIGNRLRCGIYNGTEIDKLFNDVWTDELDKAMKDRLSRKIDVEIENMIKAKLNSVLKSF